MSDKENQNVTIEEFFEFLKTYLDEKQIAFVKKAYDFAAKMHADQKRRSGEPLLLRCMQIKSGVPASRILFIQSRLLISSPR